MCTGQNRRKKTQIVTIPEIIYPFTNSKRIEIHIWINLRRKGNDTIYQIACNGAAVVSKLRSTLGHSVSITRTNCFEIKQRQKDIHTSDSHTKRHTDVQTNQNTNRQTEHKQTYKWQENESNNQFFAAKCSTKNQLEVCMSACPSVSFSFFTIYSKNLQATHIIYLVSLCIQDSSI